MPATPGIKTNEGILFLNETSGEPLKNATTTFSVTDNTNITMTKVVDKPTQYYFSGDQITFTITITNIGTLSMNGLFFTDTIDESVVPISGTAFSVTTTSGTITQENNLIEISNINITSGGEVVITITGKIA